MSKEVDDKKELLRVIKRRPNIIGVLYCVAIFNSENGFCPSMRDIIERTNIKSLSTVSDYIHTLVGTGIFKSRGVRSYDINFGPSLLMDISEQAIQIAVDAEAHGSLKQIELFLSKNKALTYKHEGAFMKDKPYYSLDRGIIYFDGKIVCNTSHIIDHDDIINMLKLANESLSRRYEEEWAKKQSYSSFFRSKE